MRTLDYSSDEEQRKEEIEAAIAAAIPQTEVYEETEVVLDTISEQKDVLPDSAVLDVKQVEAQNVR